MKGKFDKPELFDEKKINGKNKSVLSRIFFAIFIIYICFFVVFMCFFINFKVKFDCVPVKGVSMQPTINKEAVLTSVDDSAYDWVYISKENHIEYGDIVVFDARKHITDSEQKKLIKRVIALEGDAITIRLIYDEVLEKEVYKVCRARAEALADGKIASEEVEILEEDYTSSKESWVQYFVPTYYQGYSYELSFVETFFDQGNYELIKDENEVIYAIVPEEEFFYLGDHRCHSSDSRDRGTDRLKSINGVVQIIVPNAENSSSRFVVQMKTTLNYYLDMIGNFFTGLWNSLEKAFAI